MALPNELHPLQLGAGSASAYQIEQSLRVNRDDSAQMSRTFNDGGSSHTQWTFSFWTKRHLKPGTSDEIIFYTNKGSGYSRLDFGSGGGQGVSLIQYNGSGWDYRIFTLGQLRDPSAWYHVVFVYDSPNATESERLRVYINGERQVSNPSTGLTYPSQNFASELGKDATHYLFRGVNYGTAYYNGYAAETNFIDNQALDPTNFAEYDNAGVWRPIKYTGTYGGNSFYLQYASNGIGNDSSGEGNNFSPTGFTADDTMSDTPTKNFATFNPLVPGPSGFSDGNLSVTANSSSSTNRGTPNPTFKMPSSGKFYAEFTPTSLGEIAIALTQEGNGDTVISYHKAGTISLEGSGTVGNASPFTTGDVIGVSVDVDNTTVRFYKNGVAQLGAATNYSSAPDSDNCYLTFKQGSSTGSCAATANYGQRAFAYPLGTSSPTTAFNTVLYAGTSGTLSVTGAGFSPDLVWIKNRGNTQNHMLFDSIRNVRRSLNSNTTSAEVYEDSAGYLSSFDSDGFTVVEGSSSGVNWNGDNFVAWCFNAGTGSPVTNNDGTITSTVKASPENGFSVVTYAGTGAAGTVGHGLEAAPSFYVVKPRSYANNWPCYHKDLTSADYYIHLNLTLDEASAPQVWNGTAPSSTVFNIGTNTNVNQQGATFVAYCFADTPDRVKTGSYTGNSSTNYVEVGFKPAMVMLKNTTQSSQWMLVDTERGTDKALNPNRNISEYTTTTDSAILRQNGFILSGNATDTNLSGNNFIYIAFAENFTADETFKSLNTANLPAPTVKDGSKNFNTVLYTGNGSTQSITGVGFQPDWLWIKSRNQSYHHTLTDAVRGTNKQLWSNRPNEEQTNSTFVTSFDSDGFSLGDESVNGSGSVNTNNTTFAAWNWLAGNGTTTNTAGSITSTVSANPSAGFSIVSFTGTGTGSDTVGHGLGVEPKIVILKDRDNVEQWPFYHTLVDGSLDYMHLNLTDANANSGWSVPTSTVFSASGIAGNGDNVIAYCFAEVEGYSKFGRYTGNGNPDGPFVFCGFKPAWIMLKKTNTSTIYTSWSIYDTARDSYNVSDAPLYANVADQEGTNSQGTVESGHNVDILSNGFKLRDSNQIRNTSGDTYVFMAFASHPFGGDGVSPATAR